MQKPPRDVQALAHAPRVALSWAIASSIGSSTCPHFPARSSALPAVALATSAAVVTAIAMMCCAGGGERGTGGAGLLMEVARRTRDVGWVVASSSDE